MSLLFQNLQIVFIYFLHILKFPLFNYALESCLLSSYILAWAESLYSVIYALFQLPKANLNNKSFKTSRFILTLFRDFYISYLFANYHYVIVLFIFTINAFINSLLNKQRKLDKVFLFFIIDLGYIGLQYVCSNHPLSIFQLLSKAINMHFISFILLNYIVSEKNAESKPWLETDFFSPLAKFFIFAYVGFSQKRTKTLLLQQIFGTSVFNIRARAKGTEVLFTIIAILFKALPNWIFSQLINYYVDKTKHVQNSSQKELLSQYRAGSSRLIISSHLVAFGREPNALRAIMMYLSKIRYNNVNHLSFGLLLFELVYDLFILNLKLIN